MHCLKFISHQYSNNYLHHNYKWIIFLDKVCISRTYERSHFWVYIQLLPEIASVIYGLLCAALCTYPQSENCLGTHIIKLVKVFCLWSKWVYFREMPSVPETLRRCLRTRTKLRGTSKFQNSQFLHKN